MTIDPDSSGSYGQLPDDAELRELVAARCNGVASEAQWARLNELLMTRPDAVEFYVTHLSLHAALSRLSVDVDEQIDAPILADVMEQGAVTTNRLRQSNWSMWSKVSPAWAAVAMLLVVIAVGLFLWPQMPNEVVAHPVHAWLVQSSEGAEFRRLSAGDVVRQPQGTSQLVFRNGVQLTLTGEANLEVLSESDVRLNAGQIHADVGPGGEGFRVLTSNADVLDLGTVFGVQVTPQGGTDVVVFDGEVKLRSVDEVAGNRASPVPSLFQGQAVRMQANGRKSRIPTIWQNPQSSEWSTEKSPKIQSPIVAVFDNLTDESDAKYYAVVPKGFDEDAKVYVDRNYEWNSLSGTELPFELIGADYIRTFNDDKYQGELEIYLTLSDASIVYLLWDPRHLAPEWLLENFELTGQRLGMDLGNKVGAKGHRVLPPGVAGRRFLGRGPGESTDISFVVWRQIVPQAGTITLGANGQRSKSLRDSELAMPGSMYGIVVRPLESALPDDPAAVQSQ